MDSSGAGGDTGRVAARKYAPPHSWVAAGGEWPVGPLRADAPPYAVVTAAIVSAYRAAVGERSLRSVASAAGIDPTSLGRMLHGETVPDVHTVAVLEAALGVPLWPDYPRAHPSRTTA